MSIEWKSCIRVGTSIFLLFLCMRYWDAFSGFLNVFLNALSPIVLGLIFAYILNILMSFYESHWNVSGYLKKYRRFLCVFAAMLTFAAIIALVIKLVVPELIHCIQFLVAEIPPAWDNFLKSDFAQTVIPSDFWGMLSTFDWIAYLKKYAETLLSGLGNVVGSVFSAASVAVTVIVKITIGFIFAVYLLSGKERLLNQTGRLMKHYVPVRLQLPIQHALNIFNESFRRYIVGQCAEAVVLGVLCVLGMLIFRFPYAVMIGTLIGFTALVPVAGAYIGGTVGCIMILTVSPIKAVLFLVFIVILQQIEGNLIYPKVVGKSIGLPGIWVLAAVTIGGNLMGILGIVISVPIASALYQLLREDLHRREKHIVRVPADQGGNKH